MIRPIEPGYLRTVLARNVNFVKHKSRGGKAELGSIHVPEFATRAVHSCGCWRNPVIEAVTECPFITKSGRLVTSTGFDAETGVFLVCGIHPQLPSRFTHRAAAEAAQSILGLFCDFPFAAEGDRAAALAAVLTEFGKQAYEGATPAFVANANVSGAGKGLLINVIHAIQFGHEAAISTLPNSKEELQKVITSMAIAGDPTVFFDNVEYRLGGAHLEAAITATFWKDRVLGVSRHFAGTFRPTWYFSGNNIRSTAIATCCRSGASYVTAESQRSTPEEWAGQCGSARAALSMASISTNAGKITRRGRSFGVNCDETPNL